jgi:hypothetical protein
VVMASFPRARRPCGMAACGGWGDALLQRRLHLGIHAWEGGRGRMSRLSPRFSIGAAAWSPRGVWGGCAVHYAGLGLERVHGSCLCLPPLLPEGAGRRAAAWEPTDLPNTGGCPMVPLVRRCRPFRGRSFLIWLAWRVHRLM